MESFNLRQEQILEILMREGEKNIEFFSSHFDVSEMTIRRDLAFLEDNGKILRTWGRSPYCGKAIYGFLIQGDLQK